MGKIILLPLRGCFRGRVSVICDNDHMKVTPTEFAQFAYGKMVARVLPLSMFL